eukprot:5427292-Amphidinium_carterae.1
MRALAGKRSTPQGLWTDDRRARVYEHSELCHFCGEAEGSAFYTIFDCPTFEAQRKETLVQARREDIQACVP